MTVNVLGMVVEMENSKGGALRVVRPFQPNPGVGHRRRWDCRDVWTAYARTCSSGIRSSAAGKRCSLGTTGGLLVGMMHGKNMDLYEELYRQAGGAA